MANKKNAPAVDEQEQTRQFEADLQNRVQSFNAEMIPLLGKYKLGLGAQPVILPNGTIAAKPVMFDDSKPKPGAPNAPAAPQPEAAAKPESGLASA